MPHSADAPSTLSQASAPAHPTFRLGDAGPAVRDIRSRLVRLGLLPGSTDDVYDADVDHAVRTFQQGAGLDVDGVVGRQTYRRLDEAHWRFGDRLLQLGQPMLRGEDVAALQQRLTEMGFDPGRVDGIFGPATSSAVRDFQDNVGVTVDGTCGPVTIAALERLSRTVTGGAPTALRELESIRRAGPTVAGKIVVIDADGGVSGARSDEADAIVFDVAARIEGRLAALGGQAFLTRPRDHAVPDDDTRAAFANNAGADIVIALQCASYERSPLARGVATYYYGADRVGAHSAVGERLARLIQDELVRTTDLLDLRSHPKTWDLLRMTTMPTVRVELGYLSNAADRAHLLDPGFRDAVAEAVVTATHQLFTHPE